jgi:hypothetical protein
MTFHKKPGVTFWATVVVVVVLVAYPLTLGPACWLVARFGIDGADWPGTRSSRIFNNLYRPMGQLALIGPDPISSPIYWYGRIWLPKGARVYLPTYESTSTMIDDEPL